jgi:hypothetical protein
MEVFKSFFLSIFNVFAKEGLGGALSYRVQKFALSFLESSGIVDGLPIRAICPMTLT